MRSLSSVSWNSVPYYKLGIVNAEEPWREAEPKEQIIAGMVRHRKGREGCEDKPGRE